MKKPPFISHYLILRDLLNGMNVRLMNPTVLYLCSRIENIKNDIKNEGIEFEENKYVETPYSHYKLYKLVETEENIKKAENLLKKYESPEILDFLEKAEAKIEKAETEEEKFNKKLENCYQRHLDEVREFVSNTQ